MNKSFRKYIFAGFLVAFVLASCAGSAGVREKSAAQDIPLDPRIHAGVLPSGLHYYLRENKKPEGRVYLSLFVKAGSLLETDAERGAAHFVEHMAFNGTARFPKADLVNYLRSLGMRFGPEVNAYTSFDRTVYGIEVPTEGGKIPPQALAVLDDWTRAISFSPSEVDAERGVILEEYRQGLGAMDRIRRALLPVLFNGSAYADRLPIGLPEVVKTIPAQDLVAFYSRWYNPDTMAIAIVGDVDMAALEKELAVHFSEKAPAHETLVPDFELPEPVDGRTTYLALSDSELSHGFVSLYYKQKPQIVGNTEMDFRQSLVESLIFQVANERFQETAVKSAAPYSGAGMGPQRYGKASGFIVLSAAPESNSYRDSLAELLRARESLLRFGITDAELDRARKNLLSGYEQAWAEREHQESSSLVDSLSGVFLNGDCLPSLEYQREAANRLLPGIVRNEVETRIQEMLSSTDLTVVMISPEAEKPSVPLEAEVDGLIGSIKLERMEAPQAEAPVSVSVVEPRQPGTILAERREGNPEAVVWELSNGARVILVPTKNSQDEISLMALAREGEASVSDVDAVSASLSAELASASGLGPWSTSELNKLLAGKELSLSFFSSTHYHGFRGNSAGKDIPDFFQILHAAFSRPTILDDAAKAELEGLRTTLAQREQDPNTIFNDTVTREVTGNHPRFTPLTLARLDQVHLDSARGYLASCMNAGNYSFVFAGSIDPLAFKPLVERYIASLPGKREKLDWVDLGVKRPGARDVVVTKGKEDRAACFLAWFQPKVYTIEQATIAEVLTEYLDIRLTEEIREKLGGVYSPSASVSLQSVPKGELSLFASFYCDPKRTEELSGAVEKELSSIADGHVDGPTLEKAVAALKREYDTNLQSNGFLASQYASLDVVASLPLGTLAGKPDRLDRVVAADLSSLLKGLLSQGPTRIRLMPEVAP